MDLLVKNINLHMEPSGCQISAVCIDIHGPCPSNQGDLSGRSTSFNSGVKSSNLSINSQKEI